MWSLEFIARPVRRCGQRGNVGMIPEIIPNYVLHARNPASSGKHAGNLEPPAPKLYTLHPKPYDPRPQAPGLGWGKCLHALNQKCLKHNMFKRMPPVAPICLNCLNTTCFNNMSVYIYTCGPNTFKRPKSICFNMWVAYV